MTRYRICHVMALILIGAIVIPARADLSGMQEVAGMLDNPVYVTHAPGDRDRLFIIEEAGVVKILDLDSGTVNGTPFLTIPNVDVATEGGLLGFAFHPQYSTPGAGGFGKFYVYATIDPNDDTMAPEPFLSHIREYTVSANPNVANPAPREILSFLQPQANHNGGWIGFSPTDDPNYLYINFGDGGGDDDNDSGHTSGTGNSQDTTLNLLGKTLRLDISGADEIPDAARNYAIPATNPFKAGVGIPADDVGDDEIWAYGLRNPFRASFDRLTGDMWIGDVGQAAREEIDFQPANSPGGTDYGRRLREGDIATPTGGVGGAEPVDHVDPHYVYTRGTGTYQGFTVIGGYVYRGPDPELQGQYFFADAGSRHVWRFTDRTNPLGTRENINPLLGALHSQLGQPVSFGEDANGNLYLVDYGSTTQPTGQIFRILTDTLLAGDYNADGEVDQRDYQEWKSNYGAMNKPLIDGNRNGTVDAADYTVWRNNLGRSAHDQGAGTSVPEPTALVLCLPLGILLATARRFRSRRPVL